MRIILPAAVASLMLAGSALAQTSTAPTTTPSTKPGDTTTTAPSSPGMTTTTPSTAAPSATTGTTTGTTMSKEGITLTEEQARGWVDKVVYSSDGKNIGEVSAIQLDSSGKVSELHADIGGFLGLGETRVRVMPDQFRFDNDRVVLNVAGDAAKALPKIEK